jgi:putative aminopeptidase FrvX
MTSQSTLSKRITRRHLRLLQQLTEVVAVSGNEGPVRQIVRAHVEAYADDIKIDAMGNLLVTRRGSGRNRIRIMLAAHMDEVGLMIIEVDKDGYLRFDRVGGISKRQLLGNAVWVGDKRTPGIIGTKPTHLLEPKERKRFPDLDSLRIDIGVDSKEAALENIKLGEWATFATQFLRLGSTIRAKALDDRMGVATLIELVAIPPQGYDLLAAFTVQEEVGLRGARVAAHTLNPDVAIAIDCTPSMDFPTWDGEENVAYNTQLGSGPAIYVADRATIGDPRLLRLLVETAEAEAIPYQLRQPGGGGTDAGAIHLAREGIPSISVSVPTRHLHTAASIASLEDWRNSVRLIHAVISRMRKSHFKRD